MTNSFVLVGRIVNNFKMENELCELILAVPRYDINEEPETDFIKIYVKGGVYEKMNKYVNKNDVIGVKGIITGTNEEMKLMADKITFLASKSNEERK